MINKKINEASYFDGYLYIIIDNAHLIEDRIKFVESNLKFWIPNILPNKIKFILSLK